MVKKYSFYGEQKKFAIKQRSWIEIPTPFFIKRKSEAQEAHSVDRDEEDERILLNIIPQLKEENKLAEVEECPRETLEYFSNEDITIYRDDEPTIYVEATRMRCPFCGWVDFEANHLIVDEKRAKTLEAIYGENYKLFLVTYEKTPVYVSRFVSPVTRGVNQEKTQCPCCKADTTEYVVHDKDVYKVTDARNPVFSTVYRGATIKDKGDKVTLAVHYKMMYLPNNAHKSYPPDLWHRITFNVKTGQTYLLPSNDIKGKQVKGCTRSIANITRRLTNNIYEFAQDWDVIMKLLQVIASKHSNVNVAEWEKYFEEKKDKEKHMVSFLRMIIYLNRFSMFSPEEMENIIKLYASKDTWIKVEAERPIAMMFTGISPDDTREIFLQKLIKNTGIPNNTTFRKLLVSDIYNAQHITTLRNLGIKDINNLRKITDPNEVIKPLAQKVSYWGKDFRDKFKSFFKAVKEHRGSEANALKLFNEENISGWLLVDTMEMYALANQLEGFDSHRYLKGNLQEMHDNMFSFVQLVKIQENHEKNSVKYSQQEIDRFNHKIGDIYFKLADDTSELIIVGNSMHICVGQLYKEKFLERSSTIIIGYKEKKPVICIEVVENDLIQAKSHSNALATKGAYSKELQEWVKVANVETKSCHDWKF